MSQTAAHLVDHVIPHVPVRQWVLSLPIPLRVLLAAQPELVTPVLQVVQRVITRHLLDDAQLAADAGHGDAVTLIQRFGSAANLNIHLHCLALDGIKVFSNESVLPIRWPKYWSFSSSISPSTEYSVLISFRMDWLDVLAVQGTLKSLLQHHSSKASILRQIGRASC